MFVKSHGSAVLGIDALPIAAEVNICLLYTSDAADE